MKKLTTLLAALAMVFGLSGKAQAVEMYYTFEGTIISDSFDDSAGAIANAVLSIGSAVTYTFIVDFDAAGSYTLNDVGGTVVTMIDDASTDFFYTDYVSGDALVQVDGGYRNDPFYAAEYNFGWNTSVSGGLYGNSADDRVTIWSGSVASDWVVGTTVSGENDAYDSTGAYSRLWSDLTLTDISPVSAVPEPATILLLGSGLLGLGFFRRKKEVA